ncbi:MAG: hypothetical protein V5A14_02625 [Desulfohalobiaceae bacterium]
MFCPKCNYISFDHLPTCPKCAFDWSQQKKAFNVEWMVPTAAEGMNIFTPASATASQTGQAESLSGPAAKESVGKAATGEEQEIDLDVSDLEEAPEEVSSSSRAGEEPGESPLEEVDEEITFEGLQDFSSGPNDEAEPSLPPEGEEPPLEATGSGGNKQESELEIEIEDQGSVEGGEQEAEQEEDESLSVDQDELDLDITSILDDIDSDSQDKESDNK